jgi:RNA polymerase sigma-B factor
MTGPDPAGEASSFVHKIGRSVISSTEVLNPPPAGARGAARSNGAGGATQDNGTARAAARNGTRVARQNGARRAGRDDPDRERRLFLRHVRFGDPAARAELVERFLPLAHRLAHRYRGEAVSLEDLEQVACIGLVNAIDRFDPERGARFSSFAVPSILGELKRHFRDHGWAVRVPRPIKDHALEVNRAIDRLRGRLGRSPTPEELAQETALTVEDVVEAIEAGTAIRATSLEALEAGSEDEPFPRAVAGVCDGGLDLVADRDAVGRCVRGLPELQRQVLYLRFVEDLTQTEIGERIGVSQMQVSRLLRRSLAQARELMEAPA